MIFFIICLKIRKLTRLISKMYIHSYEFKEFNVIRFQTKINLLFLLHIITMEKNNFKLLNLYSFTVFKF